MFFLADARPAFRSPFRRGDGIECSGAHPDGEINGERPASDRTLLRKLQVGESDAATQLYLRYADRLRVLAGNQLAPDLSTRFDADDVVQSVFRTFFRRVVDGHYDVPAGEELWGLFLVIALNKIRSAAAFHRAGKRDVGRTEGLQENPGAVRPENQEALLMLQSVIDELLDELPEVHQQIVLLRIEQHRISEIARTTQRSKRSVERILQQFRARLSERIQPDLEA